jgi:hypothetical protein
MRLRRGLYLEIKIGFYSIATADCCQRALCRRTAVSGGFGSLQSARLLYSERGFRKNAEPHINRPQQRPDLRQFARKPKSSGEA